MATQWLLIGVPLLIFAIIDSLGNQKAALISAIAIAAGEFILSYYLIDAIDWTSVISVLLVVGLACLSLYKKDTIHFKLQPAIVAAVVGVLFLGSYLLGKPFLFEMMVKYKSILPEAQRGMIEMPQTQVWLDLVTLYGGILFILHAAFMVWVAYKCSNWFWVISRIVGTVLSCFGAVVLAKMHLG